MAQEDRNDDACFPVHDDSIVLSESVSKKVVKYARRRLVKSGIIEYTENENVSVDQLSHSQLDLGELLGQGSFSSVYEIKSINAKGYTKGDANSLVVKVLRPKLALKPAMLAACAADIAIEGMMLSVLNHENVVALKAMAPVGINAYMNGCHDAYFLVMEKLHDTLSDKFARWQKQTRGIFKSKKNTNIIQEQCSAIMQLNAAVEYLHSNGLLHRDLKPANIGFDNEGVLKVFDFDVARIVPVFKDENETFLMTKRTGSARYMAPEVARGDPYNLKADVYTFGLLCHEIISLKKPFEEIPSEKHNQCVFYDGVRPSIPSSWPEGFTAFLERAWSPVIEERPTMKECERILETELKSFNKKSSKKSGFLNRAKTAPINVTA